jgi:hypothetical protein
METINANATAQKPVSEERPERLQVLIGELLEENQKLRFQVAALERQAQSAERGLADATKWAGTLL